MVTFVKTLQLLRHHCPKGEAQHQVVITGHYGVCHRQMFQRNIATKENYDNATDLYTDLRFVFIVTPSLAIVFYLPTVKPCFSHISSDLQHV